MQSLHTLELHNLVARHQAGDPRALDLLIRQTGDRLERLARKMLRSYPSVRDREETCDVLQNALIRLTRALSNVTPDSVRDYYRLASEQIRRELLDLAKFHRRRPVLATEFEMPEPERDGDLENWALLQEAVERLPVLNREVFSLTFYHGWTQAQIGEVLGISDRQVRRVWVETCMQLQTMTENRLPAN
jgi:RNA polymerase sigma factor (sigma-70 family)